MLVISKHSEEAATAKKKTNNVAHFLFNVTPVWSSTVGVWLQLVLTIFKGVYFLFYLFFCYWDSKRSWLASAFSSYSTLPAIRSKLHDEMLHSGSHYIQNGFDKVPLGFWCKRARGAKINKVSPIAIFQHRLVSNQNAKLAQSAVNYHNRCSVGLQWSENSRPSINQKPTWNQLICKNLHCEEPAALQSKSQCVNICVHL